MLWGLSCSFSIVNRTVPMPVTHLLARAVVRDDDHVLVVQSNGQSHTFLPGGHREAGEGLEACLRRELREELGVRAHVGDYLGAIEHQWWRNGEQQYEINHCFSTTIPSLEAPTIPSSREEYLTFSWVRTDRLDAVALEPAPLRHLLDEHATSGTPWWRSTLPRERASSTDGGSTLKT